MPRRDLDHTADRPLHKQLADILREGIRTGEYQPGGQLPSEPRLIQIHELGRETIRRAVDLLVSEGLVVRVHGRGTFVREAQEYQIVKLQPGDRVTTRIPTPEERKELGIAEGVAVFVITDVEGNERLLAGDATMLEA